MVTRIACAALILGVTACAETRPDEHVPYNALGGGGGNIGAGTGGDPGYDPECDESMPTYDQVTVFAKCMNCHSSSKMTAERKGAPAEVNFDTKSAADASANRAAAMVKSGAMPPRSTGLILTDMERQKLFAWAKCAM